MSKILVETSARHVHLSQDAIDTLFGKGYTLTNKKDLSQPGQFACEEKVGRGYRPQGKPEEEHSRSRTPCKPGRDLSLRRTRTRRKGTRS